MSKDIFSSLIITYLQQLKTSCKMETDFRNGESKQSQASILQMILNVL